MTLDDLKKEAWIYPDDIVCFIVGHGFGKLIRTIKSKDKITVVFEYKMKKPISWPKVEFIYSHELLSEDQFVRDLVAGDMFHPSYTLEKVLERDPFMDI